MPLERRGKWRLAPRPTLRVERRASREVEAEIPHIVGHAAVFGEWTTLYSGRYYEIRERVNKGAFRNALKEGPDCRALFNHDANYILGRTTSGTLALKEDDDGLWSDCVPPQTQTIRDLVLTPIERGDVSGMSFAFSVRKGDKVKTTENKDGTVVIEHSGERITIRPEGERTIEEYELLDLDIFDVSPVVYPAYDGTDVGMRNMFAPDIQKRIAEMDRPRRVQAPIRESLRSWLG